MEFPLFPQTPPWRGMGRIFITIASMSSVGNPSFPIVSVELLLAVDWHEQGRMEVPGYWQFNADSDEKEVAVESLQVAWTTNGDVEFDTSQSLPPQLTVAPQSNGSENKENK